MFADKNFSNEINMSGVNSINWARIIAQSVYYFYSYFLIEDRDEPLNFSVPTGNFGDVYKRQIKIIYTLCNNSCPIDRVNS